MFDIIRFRCTECGNHVDVQSKGGDCRLVVYDANAVPLDVAGDADRHAPHKCDCGAKFVLNPEPTHTVRLYPIKIN